jgi:hypothetical protein
MDMIRVGKVTMGASYRRHCLVKVNMDGEQCTVDREGLVYQVLNFARHDVTHQWQVIYIGIEGADLGKLSVCSLSEFAIHFREVIVDPGDQEDIRISIPQKAADHAIKGSGK